MLIVLNWLMRVKYSLSFNCKTLSHSQIEFLMWSDI